MEFVNVDDVSSELKCSICLLPWTDALQTPCEHIFCGKCLLPHVQSSKNCPDCRRAIPNTKDLVKPARPLLSMANRVAVYCTNKKRGCTWSGERGNLDSHLTSCVSHPPPEESNESEKTVGIVLQSVNEFPLVKADKTAKVLVMAHIAAPIKKETEARKPINVSAVIDISGSMGDGKLELVKETMRFVVSELAADDQLGIVVFDDVVEERFTLSNMTSKNKQEILGAIERLQPRGSTNLSDGLFGGMNQIRGLPISEGVAPSDTVTSRGPVKVPQRSSGVGSTLRNAMNAILASTSNLTNSLSTSHRDAATSSVYPAGTRLDVKVEISHDYTSFKRDTTTLHRYTVRVKVSPTNAAVTSINGSNATYKTWESTAVVHTCPIQLDFLPEFNHKAETINYKLGTEEDGSFSSTYAVSNAVPDKDKSRGSKKLDEAENPSINAVWLFTDGEANAGIVEPNALVEATKKHLASHPKDICVFTFGFGSSHNSNLLQKISEASQGSYYYIENKDTIKESFADCLGGLLSVVAQNIKLELVLNGNVTLERLMTQYPNKTKDGIVEVTMKDLYSEEQRDILVSLNLPASTPTTAYLLATWRLTYLNLLSGAIETIQVPATVALANEVPPSQEVNTDLDKQRNRILVTEAMEAAKKEADAGRLKEARALLTSCSAAVNTSSTNNDHYVQALQKDLLVAEECMVSQSQYNSVGTKQMAQMWSGHAQQRCNTAGDTSVYQTSAKAVAKGKSKGFF